MPFFSLKKKLGRFDDLNFSNGIMNSFLQHQFYKNNPDMFPYKRSVRSLVKALEWPKEYISIGDYPVDQEPVWSNDAQGIVNTGKSWHITQTTTLWKFPNFYDLAAEIDEDDLPQGVLKTGIPDSLQPFYIAEFPIVPGVEHLGDLDYYSGHLYVPCEGNGLIPDKIALYDSTNLAYLSYADLDHEQSGFSAPWCAINPLNNLLYSSTFNPTYLHVYRPKITNNQITLEKKGKFNLYDDKGNTINLSRIQGGAFSENGHLYLVSDTPPIGHVFGFDMITGHKVKEIDIHMSHFDYPELEGMTIRNLLAVDTAGISGQVHIQLLSNEADSDNVSIIHFKVPDEDENKI